MDISGKVIQQIETTRQTVEINVSDLPKGLYLVELKNELGSNLKKLVIE